MGAAPREAEVASSDEVADDWRAQVPPKSEQLLLLLAGLVSIASETIVEINPCRGPKAVRANNDASHAVDPSAAFGLIDLVRGVEIALDEKVGTVRIVFCAKRDERDTNERLISDELEPLSQRSYRRVDDLAVDAKDVSSDREGARLSETRLSDI
jgi:hypothetical protein